MFSSLQVVANGEKTVMKEEIITKEYHNRSIHPQEELQLLRFAFLSFQCFIPKHISFFCVYFLILPYGTLFIY